MLTGDATRADALVLTAFRGLVEGQVRPGGAGAGTEDDIGHALREKLVHAYLADARHHRREAAEVSSRGDPADVLASLSPRERTATVLVRAEGWSQQEAGAAMRIGPGRVASLVPSIPGLDLTLDAVADQHARPDDEIVANLLASLRSGSAEVGEPGGERPDEQEDTRRQPVIRATGHHRARWLAAAAIVVTGGGAAAALLDGNDIPETLPDSADGTRSAEAGTDLTARGWVLDEEGDPPASLEGLRLLESTTIDYRRPTEPLELDTAPRSGNAVFAALWCDIPALDTNLAVPSATLTVSGETMTLPCAGKGGDPGVVELVPLPPQGSRDPPVSVAWSGDLPGRGSAVLATYTETGLVEARTQVGLSEEAPPVAADAVLLDGTDVRYQVDEVEIFVQRVVVSDQTRLSIWAGQTGRFMVLVDGVVASDDGDLAVVQLQGPLSEVWREQDPELQDGFWIVPAPGHVREIDLPALVRPARGQVAEVTVTAIVDADAEAPWQVHAAPTTPVDLEPSEVPASSTDDLPKVPGHRLVGAWKVPMTGYPYPLATPPPLTADTVFTSIAPSDVEYPGAAWSREGIVSSELGTVSMPAGIDEYWAVQFMEYWPGWGEMGAESSVGRVSASFLGHSSSVDHVTVMAYEPEP